MMGFAGLGGLLFERVGFSAEGVWAEINILAMVPKAAIISGSTAGFISDREAERCLYRQSRDL